MTHRPWCCADPYASADPADYLLDETEAEETPGQVSRLTFDPVECAAIERAQAEADARYAAWLVMWRAKVRAP